MSVAQTGCDLNRGQREILAAFEEFGPIDPLRVEIAALRAELTPASPLLILTGRQVVDEFNRLRAP